MTNDADGGLNTKGQMTDGSDETTPSAAFVASSFPLGIRTARLSLVPVEAALAPALFAVIDNERERLGKWLPWVAGLKTEADEAAAVETLERTRREGTQASWAIFAPEIGCGPMGVMGIFDVCPKSCSLEFGWWASQMAEGRGFMEEAGRALMCAALDLGARKMRVSCARGNSRSMMLALRLGFKEISVGRTSEGVCHRRFEFVPCLSG